MAEQNKQIDDILSYGYLLKNISKFKSSGGRHSDDFNRFDVPAHLFFKPVFYFWNGDSDRQDDFTHSGGLLAPTWMNDQIENYYDYNSAWAYLKLNNENERAIKLQKFVELLSNISINSPWYFQSIEGLSEVITRPIDTEIKVEDTRKKITIKCLQDSYDNRIGTLLDLYREIVFSWIHKREVIPANLRKFDMGIYLFSSPIVNLHNPGKQISADSKDLFKTFRKETETASVNPNSSKYITSYKYIEFHNCEINYNSSASGVDALDNAEGISPTYSIEIFYDDCYETRYNEFMAKTMGDLIQYDLDYNYQNEKSKSLNGFEEIEKTLKNIDELGKRIDLYEGTGFLKEIVGSLEDRGDEFITQKVMGNLHGFSLSQGITDLSNLNKGKFFSTADTVKDAVKKVFPHKPKFRDSNVFQTPIDKARILEKSNIFKNKTIINNI